MPYKIKKFNNGYKVCKLNNDKCFSNKNLSLENAKKQMKAIIYNENKNLFKKQLNEYKLTLEEYLNLAKIKAKLNNYNPNLLSISNDGKHKLNYDGINFGKISYKDKIIYAWLEFLNKIDDGTTKLKSNNYRKRSYNVMKKTNNNLSPASLSYYILW